MIMVYLHNSTNRRINLFNHSEWQPLSLNPSKEEQLAKAWRFVKFRFRLKSRLRTPVDSLVPRCLR